MRKTWRKRAAALLLLTLLLGLCACGRNATPPADTAENVPADTETPETPEAQAEPETRPEDPDTAENADPLADTPCLELTDQLPYELDWDGDGEKETVDMVAVHTNNSDDPSFPLKLTNGGETWRSMDPGVWTARLYLTRLDGSYALLLTGDSGSCDYVTYCWRLTAGDPEPVRFTGETRYDTAAAAEHLEAEFMGLDESGNLTFEGLVYMLGTYGAQRPYTLDADGTLAPVDGSLWDYVNNEQPITARIDLEAKSVSARNGEADGGTLTIPAGSKLLLTGSDGTARAWFEWNGQFGVFEVEKRDYQWFIGGLEENEVFGDLPYAG